MYETKIIIFIILPTSMAPSYELSLILRAVDKVGGIGIGLRVFIWIY